MTITLPDKVRQILHRLQESGYEAYAVGGCVRDTLLGREPMDWDITTSAKPQQVKALFARTIDTGIQHGTVTIMLGDEGFEVTTYRIDGEYEDGRHPKEVVYTASLYEDLRRRDFTINAMAYNEISGLVDEFDGAGDLARGIIRCVGEARERFLEDALRMLRAVRFAAQLGFEIEQETKAAIGELAPNLSKVSAERIQVELLKLLTSNHPEELRTIYETGISAVVLPEWDEMMRTQQNNKHHCYSVGEHTIHALQQIPNQKVLRLAALLHDVSKPECRTRDEQGMDHFYGHPEQGAKRAREILNRLKFDNATRDAVCRLVRWHDYNPQVDERHIRRAIYKVGVDQYPDIFAVKRADVLAQSDYHRSEKLDYLQQYEDMYAHIMEQEQCLSLKQLALTGSDLIALGMKPGKKIGETLNQLLELVLEDPDKNTKEYLTGYTLKNLFI